jgi:AcrR family transcriptional regulator
LWQGDFVAKRPKQSPRRGEALSKARIVQAAINILDFDGEAALTFRALAARLATGSGAIYWHVADRNGLLAAATGDALAPALAQGREETEPKTAIRAIALGIFDAIDAHPWAGAHLSREPWHPVVGEIFERVGGRLEALGIPGDALFDGASALANYILGVACQNAANARLLPVGADRREFLAGIAARWTQDDPESHPFLRQVAERLREHDDRQQFLAGIDLILAGACAS